MSDALAGRRALAWTGCLVACLAACAMAFIPGTAMAGKGVVGVFGSSGSGDGQFSSAGSTAVNASTGDVYVVDPGNNRVEQFDASGSFIRTWGWGVTDGSSAFQECTSSCQAGVAGSGDGQFDGPQGIAIDQSDGSVYVVDGNNARVEKFSSSGAYVSQFGAAGSGDGQLSGPQGVAVDPTDRSVLVADTNNNRVVQFDASGTFVRTWGWGVSDGNGALEVCTSTCQAGVSGSGDGQFSSPTRVAVDSTGRVYVLDSGNSRIERFASGGTFDEVFDPTDVFLPSEIAVGPSDHLYVAQWATDFSEQRVVEIDPSGTLVDTHGVGSTSNNPSGLALDGTGQHIYLADGFNARVFIMAALTPATVSIDPISNITSNSASATGTVNPQGTDTSWRFEISTDGSNWSPLAADQDAGSGTSDVPVSQNLSGLLPNQTYFVRLVATRQFNAPVATSAVQFTTVAIEATVDSGHAQDVTQTHVVLDGLVNPNNAPTTYYFEYGPTTSYGTSIPVGHNGDAGSGTNLIDVYQRVNGLTPGATYHYRLVAQNAGGTATGADATFTMLATPAVSTCPNDQFRVGPSAKLPDCRAYELVSPPDKNGSDVMGDAARTRASAAGDALEFASLGAFADARGTGTTTEYISERDGAPGTSGWATHSITPRQDPLNAQALSGGLEPLWSGDLSPDLSRGVFNSWSPLTNDPNVANVQNIYQRTDLRTPGAGTYSLVTGCPACASPLAVPLIPFFNLPRYGDYQPVYVGASADFSHVLFESPYHLTSDATGNGPFLYEWGNGTVSLAGILPDGTAASSSIAGRPGFAGRGSYTSHVISNDGRRVFFMTDVTQCPSAFACGSLYMRVDNGTPSAQTVKLSGPSPATFWTATPDGSRVYFTSSDALTANAPVASVKLYMYDTTKPNSDPNKLTLLSTDSNLTDGPSDVIGVIGASDDGHAVYFVGFGQFVPGKPFIPGYAIFESRDGVVTYVGQLQQVGLDEQRDLPTRHWDISVMQARVAPDGRSLLFVSHSGQGLTGYDQGSSCSPNTDLTSGTSPCAELYRYSEATGTVSCVSCNQSGSPATSDGTDMVRVNTGGAVTSSHLSHAISDDGRWVFFSTRDALVPGDVNNKVDAYEYDSQTGEVHLLSTGTDPSDSYFLDASADGRTVFILTRQQLVGWDTDGNYDVYAVRLDGGVPDPAPQPVCSGDGCQGPAGGTPSGAAPGTSALQGAGNVKQTLAKPKAKRALKCRRGYVRKKVKGRVKCVKKRAVKNRQRKAKRAGAHRASHRASHTRRAR